MNPLRRFAFEDGSDLAVLVAGLEQRAPFEREPNRTIDRTVYDTFDWRLFEARTVLEHERVTAISGTRKSTARTVPWLIWRSIDTGEVLGRLAMEQVGQFVWDLPNEPIVERLAPILEMRALQSLVTIRIEQVSLRLLGDEGKTEARVVIDRAWLPGADDPLAPVVEVIPVRGYADSAERLAELLAAQVVLRPVDHDVVEIALASVGFNPGGYRSKLDVSLDQAGTARDAIIEVLEALFAAMMANEPGTRADIDTEFLHDYRVAVRRTRSVLGMASGVVPERLLEHLRSEFKWLGDITTPTRDLDVYLLTYPEFEASLTESMRADLRSLRSFLVTHQHRAHLELVEGLDSARYVELMHRYQHWLAHPKREPGASDPRRVPRFNEPAVTFASTCVWKAYRRLIKAGRRITVESPPESLHDLRKDAKKLRYALECFGSLFVAGEITPLIKALKGVQDVLGEFQDCEVQKGSLRGFGESMVTENGVASVPAVLAMGQLIDQIDEREHAARQQFAAHFESFDAKETRMHFRTLFAPASDGVLRQTDDGDVQHDPNSDALIDQPEMTESE